MARFMGMLERAGRFLPLGKNECSMRSQVQARGEHVSNCRLPGQNNNPGRFTLKGSHAREHMCFWHRGHTGVCFQSLHVICASIRTSAASLLKHVLSFFLYLVQDGAEPLDFASKNSCVSSALAFISATCMYFRKIRRIIKCLFFHTCQARVPRF